VYHLEMSDKTCSLVCKANSDVLSHVWDVESVTL